MIILKKLTHIYLTGLVIAFLYACSVRDVQVNLPSQQQPAAIAPLVSGYLKGQLAEREGHFEQAGDYYLQAIAQDPQHTNLIEHAFNLQLASGHIETAIDLARVLSTRTDPNPIAQLLLSLNAATKKDFAQADDMLKQASRVAPTLLQFQLVRSYTDLAKGRNVDEIIAELKSFKTHLVLTAHQQFHIARLYERAGRIVEAISGYEKALKADPGSIFTVTHLGKLYEMADEPQEARRVYDTFRKINPDTVLLDAAYKRLKTGKRPSFKDYTLKNDLAEVMFGFATLMVSQNIPLASRQLLQTTLWLDKNYPFARFYFGILEEQEGRTAEAENWYNQVPANSAARLAARLRMAQLTYERGDVQSAKHQIKQLAENSYNSYVPHRTLAEFYYQEEDYSNAVKHYSAVLESDNTPAARHASLYFARGVAYERLNRYPEAANDLKASLELEPNNPTVLNYLGYMWIDMEQNVDDAFLYISKALLLRPNDGTIVDSLGWAYYKQGDYAKAVRFLERAVELLPTDPVINEHLGDTYHKLGRIDEARLQWQRALNMQPESAMAARRLERKLMGVTTAQNDTVEE